MNIFYIVCSRYHYDTDGCPRVKKFYGNENICTDLQSAKIFMNIEEAVQAANRVFQREGYLILCVTEKGFLSEEFYAGDDLINKYPDADNQTLLDRYLSDGYNPPDFEESDE
jgi:hypothetical protein